MESSAENGRMGTHELGLADLEQRLDALERRIAEQGERTDRALDLLTRIESLIAAPRGLWGQSTRHQRTLDAVVRRLYLDPAELEFPLRLTAQRFRGDSQNEEDGITLALFREIGIGNATFVEIGCGANGGNSGFLARELGWSGLMVDGNEYKATTARRRFNPSRVKVISAWVTREGIDELLAGNGFAGETDLLSIDIDGNDYWVWEAITACSPRAVIVEYNARFGPDRAVVVPYDPGFDRQRFNLMYYGASLAALAGLASRKGYRLIAVEPHGVNAYFLRDDVAPSIPGCAPRDVYLEIQASPGKEKRQKARKRPRLTLYEYIEDNDLPLVEVGAPPDC